jgi:thiol-disulfide isomerase/thioredoxin
MRKWVSILAVLLFAAVASGQKIRSIKATDMEKIIADSKGPLIINMWATWCKPCIEELPYFIEEVNKHNTGLQNSDAKADSIQIILISLDFKEDYPGNIAAFAKKRNFNAPVMWLDETNADYFCPKLDAKWSGAIPATLFINNKTGYRNFVEEQISHEKLKEIMAILKKN